ncbi:hypothetical protein FEM21_29980 [Flavobacterium seoulense]|uniref:Uncharacterized protein n=1 Tax=Flavobacterium seoulense TaxID=1492738 RepID=A0A066WIL9_9FLAO|nr:hypothetical protein FEM21_29980 [Flavobacterium seoulense]
MLSRKSNTNRKLNENKKSSIFYLRYFYPKFALKTIQY